jgi:hypothetical protein
MSSSTMRPSCQEVWIQVWSTLLRSGTDYLVFELMDDEGIAGCVKSADQRIVNPSRW